MDTKREIDRLLTDLTRVADQIERAVDGDITINVGGAALAASHQDVLSKQVQPILLAVLGMEGFVVASALEKLTGGLAPSLSDALSVMTLTDRLQAAMSKYKARQRSIDALLYDLDNSGPAINVEATIPQGVELNEKTARDVLASMGLGDIDSIRETSPGTFEGVSRVSSEGIEDSPFNPERLRFSEKRSYSPKDLEIDGGRVVPRYADGGIVGPFSNRPFVGESGGEAILPLKRSAPRSRHAGCGCGKHHAPQGG